MVFTLSSDVNAVNMLCKTVGMAAKPYHHGDLERALLDAAAHVVRTDGIASLSLRDLTKEVGVTPSAAYRHFPSREHLVATVSLEAREALARAMLHAAASTPMPRNPQRRAAKHLEVIGRAYVQFAVDHPSEFVAAFTISTVRPPRPENPEAWSVLTNAIDEMIHTGAIPPARRKDALLIAWSSVHGLATILTAAPQPDGVQASTQIEAVVAGVLRAIT